MNKQQLAAKIWESANKMRSKIEANEYKDYILGFIFYKFLSEKEVKYLKANDWTDEYLLELTEEEILIRLKAFRRTWDILFLTTISFQLGLQKAAISVFKMFVTLFQRLAV